MAQMGEFEIRGSRAYSEGMGTEAFRHDALVYDSDEEYAARSVAFLREGLDAGECCVVGHNRAGLATMREALGADADRVEFINLSWTYTRPARAVAAYYGTFCRALRRGPSVRAGGEFQFGPTFDDWQEWQSYEAVTNLSYAHLPVWVVCTYPANRLPDAVLDGVLSTHGAVLTDGRATSEHLEDPRDAVRRLTPEPQSLPDLRSWSVGSDLERFRERLARELVAERVPHAKAIEMLIAGNEIAANALRHGAGIEEVRVGRVDGRFVCEVIDRGGGFDDPVAGYLAPRPGTGTGLWVARQLTWKIESFQSSRGFAVRMWS
jgi:anti-sigma regulatory factor (Ser/Thr protein kinase)